MRALCLYTQSQGLIEEKAEPFYLIISFIFVNGMLLTDNIGSFLCKLKIVQYIKKRDFHCNHATVLHTVKIAFSK